MNQLAINFTASRAAGAHAAQGCLDKAARRDPLFAEKAAAAILAHLRAVKYASGEELTDVAIAHGATPHDARAFGQVFATLSRRGLIRTHSFCLRSKGHSTAGGRIWMLVE